MVNQKILNNLMYKVQVKFDNYMPRKIHTKKQEYMFM